MNRSRWILPLCMALVLAFSMACLTLFPETQEPYPTEDWSQPERGPLKFEPQSLPDAQVGLPYEVEIKVSENETPVGDFSVSPNTLPPGLELVIVEEVDDTARISGMPEEPGTYTFTISVWCYGTNVSGQTGEKEYTIIVK